MFDHIVIDIGARKTGLIWNVFSTSMTFSEKVERVAIDSSSVCTNGIDPAPELKNLQENGGLALVAANKQRSIHDCIGPGQGPHRYQTVPPAVKDVHSGRENELTIAPRTIATRVVCSIILERHNDTVSDRIVWRRAGVRRNETRARLLDGLLRSKYQEQGAPELRTALGTYNMRSPTVCVLNLASGPAVENLISATWFRASYDADPGPVSGFSFFVNINGAAVIVAAVVCPGIKSLLISSGAASGTHCQRWISLLARGPWERRLSERGSLAPTLSVYVLGGSHVPVTFSCRDIQCSGCSRYTAHRSDIMLAEIETHKSPAPGKQVLPTGSSSEGLERSSPDPKIEEKGAQDDEALASLKTWIVLCGSHTQHIQLIS